MLRHSKVTLALAIVVLASLVGAEAQANRLSITGNAGGLFKRHRWNPLTFTTSEGGISVRCPVTLEGSFASRTIAKTLNMLLGRYNRAISGTCTGGSLTILQETLPWHLRYRGFVGRLPNITRIRRRITGAGWRLEVLGIPCLYRTTEESPWEAEYVVDASGTITSVISDETLTIPSSGGLCPPGRISGTGTVTEVGATSTIQIRLI